MLKYRDENIIKSYRLSSRALIDLEYLLLKNMVNHKKFHIYDIYGGDSELEIGPELCMRDVLSKNQLIEKMYNSGKYFLSYNFQDLKHQVYLRLSDNSTTINISGTDEAWVIGKSKQIKNFLEENAASLLKDEEININKIKSYKPARKGKTPLNKAGEILMFFALVSLLITAALFVWYLIGISQPMTYQY